MYIKTVEYLTTFSHVSFSREIKFLFVFQTSVDELQKVSLIHFFNKSRFSDSVLTTSLKKCVKDPVFQGFLGIYS